MRVLSSGLWAAAVGAAHAMKSRMIASKLVLFQFVAGRDAVQSEAVSSATVSRGFGIQ